MDNTIKRRLLKYAIPGVMLMVIAVQLFLVYSKNLSRWKGGGYGMYTEIHYFHNKIYIKGMSVDSLVKDDDLKDTLGFLKLIPNRDRLKEAAELVLKKTKKDSVHMQIWKPIMNVSNGEYTRVLIDEIYLKKKLP